MRGIRKGNPTIQHYLTVPWSCTSWTACNTEHAYSRSIPAGTTGRQSFTQVSDANNPLCFFLLSMRISRAVCNGFPSLVARVYMLHITSSSIDKIARSVISMRATAYTSIVSIFQLATIGCFVMQLTRTSSLSSAHWCHQVPRD